MRRRPAQLKPRRNFIFTPRVLRHQDIAGNHEDLAPPHRFKLSCEDSIGSLPRPQCLSSITVEGQKMKTAALLITNQAPRQDDEIPRRNGRPRFVVSRPSIERIEGWGTQCGGKIRVGRPPTCQNRNQRQTRPEHHGTVAK